MVHAISLGLAIYALWLLLSGHYVPLLLTFGVASTALVVWIAHRMDVVDHEGVPLHLPFRIVGYWAWLLKEIIVTNVQVAKLALSPQARLSPVLQWVDTTQKTDLALVIHANSITLTPGTISAEIEGNKILVHALTVDFADLEAASSLDSRVTALEAP